MKPTPLPRLFARDPQRPRVPIDLVIVTPRQRLIRRLDEYCREHGTTFAEMRAADRVCATKIGHSVYETTKLEVLRNLIQYMRETQKKGYADIGSLLGKDHSTVQYHAKKKMRDAQNERRRVHDQNTTSVSCLSAVES